MSRHQHDTRVYALFDVPGTGFRDREGSAMHTQYHKIGWQKDFKSSDSPENQYDLCCNPVVVRGVHDTMSTQSIQTACGVFGRAARLHRPVKESGDLKIVPSMGKQSGDDASDEIDVARDDSSITHEPFVIVTFEDDLSAKRAMEVGVAEVDVDGSGVINTEHVDGIGKQSEPKGRVSLQIVPRKLLVAEVCKWRAAVKRRFAEETAARLPTRNVGPSDDPTEWCNAGNNFRKRFPELVGKA